MTTNMIKIDVAWIYVAAVCVRSEFSYDLRLQEMNARYGGAETSVKTAVKRSNYAIARNTTARYFIHRHGSVCGRTAFESSNCLYKYNHCAILAIRLCAIHPPLWQSPTSIRPTQRLQVKKNSSSLSIIFRRATTTGRNCTMNCNEYWKKPVQRWVGKTGKTRVAFMRYVYTLCMRYKRPRESRKVVELSDGRDPVGMQRRLELIDRGTQANLSASRRRA